MVPCRIAGLRGDLNGDGWLRWQLGYGGEKMNSGEVAEWLYENIYRKLGGCTFCPCTHECDGGVQDCVEYISERLEDLSNEPEP